MPFLLPNQQRSIAETEGMQCCADLHSGLSTEEAWTVFQNPLPSSVRQSAAEADTGFSDGQWLDYWCQLMLMDCSCV